MQYHIKRTNASEYQRLIKKHPGKTPELIADEFNRQWNFSPFKTRTEAGRNAEIAEAKRHMSRIG